MSRGWLTEAPGARRPGAAMIEWAEEGLVLAVRPHGETAAIVELFTAGHGRHAGVVRGGASRRLAPVLQPGNQVAARWTARLAEHLGHFTVEPVAARAAAVMADPAALAAMGAVCGLLAHFLPERAADPGLYARTLALVDALAAGVPVEDWAEAYLRWELALLADLGFGLDLSRCAVTGAQDELAYVSPRSGRAVSRHAAGEWADRLLPLPAVFSGRARGLEAIVEGLALTGHFLAHKVAPAVGHAGLPAARQRLIDRLARAAATRPGIGPTRDGEVPPRG